MVLCRFFIFETGSYCVALAGLDLAVVCVSLEIPEILPASSYGMMGYKGVYCLTWSFYIQGVDDDAVSEVAFNSVFHF